MRKQWGVSADIERLFYVEQDCKSFRVVGSSCCDFECLDKAFEDGGSVRSGSDSAADLGSHFVAWTVSVVLSVSLIYFLFRRLRKKRHLSESFLFVFPFVETAPSGRLEMKMEKVDVCSLIRSVVYCEIPF